MRLRELAWPLHPQLHPVLGQKLFEGEEKAPYKVRNAYLSASRSPAPSRPAPPRQNSGFCAIPAWPPPPHSSSPMETRWGHLAWGRLALPTWEAKGAARAWRGSLVAVCSWLSEHSCRSLSFLCAIRRCGGLGAVISPEDPQPQGVPDTSQAQATAARPRHSPAPCSNPAAALPASLGSLGKGLPSLFQGSSGSSPVLLVSFPGGAAWLGLPTAEKWGVPLRPVSFPGTPPLPFSNWCSLEKLGHAPQPGRAGYCPGPTF